MDWSQVADRHQLLSQWWNAKPATCILTRSWHCVQDVLFRCCVPQNNKGKSEFLSTVIGEYKMLTCKTTCTGITFQIYPPQKTKTSSPGCQVYFNQTSIDGTWEFNLLHRFVTWQDLAAFHSQMSKYRLGRMFCPCLFTEESNLVTVTKVVFREGSVQLNPRPHHHHRPGGPSSGSSSLHDLHTHQSTHHVTNFIFCKT